MSENETIEEIAEGDEPADTEAGAERELTPGEQARLEEIREKRREALAQVRTFGDPVLKSRASEVTEFGAHLDAEADRMFALMHDALGIGLAATQLGSMRRMLVFQAGPDAEPRAIVNPEIEWLSEDLVTAEEGCLSLPGIAVDVERPLHARVSARDTAGGRILLEASGLEARVLQHEIDHLDGVLILDRTEREQRRAAMRALRNDEAFSPEMLEPDYEEPAAEGEPGDDDAGEH
jgi:peptide deformylase